MILPAELRGMRIVIDDIIPPLGPYCAWGARTWAKSRGLNPRDLFESGIPAEVVLAFDDHLANEVVARKIKRMTQ